MDALFLSMALDVELWVPYRWQEIAGRGLKQDDLNQERPCRSWSLCALRWQKSKTPNGLTGYFLGVPEMTQTCMKEHESAFYSAGPSLRE
jgi:hypothetical protein